MWFTLLYAKYFHSIMKTNFLIHVLIMIKNFTRIFNIYDYECMSLNQVWILKESRSREKGIFSFFRRACLLMTVTCYYRVGGNDFHQTWSGNFFNVPCSRDNTENILLNVNILIRKCKKKICFVDRSKLFCCLISRIFLSGFIFSFWFIRRQQILITMSFDVFIFDIALLIAK